MITALIPLLTTVIGAVTRRGPKAKANAGAIGGTAGVLAYGALESLLDPFIKGLTEGISGPVEQLGYALGAVVIGGGITWLTTWIAPKNAD